MSIIKRDNLNKLFDLNQQDRPKVHNKHHRTAPPDAVYIGRGSPWGNPYVIGIHGDRQKVIDLYREHVLPKLEVSTLRGKHLVCFCKPLACHGDLLLKAANAETVSEAEFRNLTGMNPKTGR